MNWSACARLIRSGVLLGVLLIFSATNNGIAATPAGDDPVGVVQAIYKYHLGHPNGSSDQTIKTYRADFLPSLYEMLLKEWKKPVAAGDAPEIDWDILLASQEFPTSLKIGKPRIGADGNAKVDVMLFLDRDKWTVEVWLAKTKDGWKVSDLYYPSEKETLSKELRDLNGKK